MASDKDEQKERQQRREAARKKRERERRLLITRLVIAGVALVFCGILIWYVSAGGRRAAQPDTPASTGTEPSAAPAATKATTATEPQGETTVIHIAAAGDLNVTDKVIAAGKTTGGYDFTQVFQDVAPVLSNADLAVMNFEGNLFGEPYGTDSASAPQELMEALASAGVDLVQMANSCAIRNGILGLSATLDGIRAAGMESVGAWATNSEFRESKGYTIREVQGLRIAIVAFTKGMNNLGLPSGSENCVNLLYDDYATTYNDVASEKITRILRDVAQEQPDFTIALLHWGSEYKEDISSTQEDIQDLMLAQGVDVIIGTHPHLVQKITWDQEQGTLVAYSLGDFFGDGEKAGSNYSIILDLEITRDNVTGQTRLTGYSYTPIYTIKPEESGDTGLRVLRIEQAMAAYEAGFLDRVTQAAYENMAYALTRADDRASGRG